MTNENEFEKQANLWLKMQPSEFKKNEDGSYFHESTYRQYMVWQAATQSQQEEFEGLKIKIEEFRQASSNEWHELNEEYNENPHSHLHGKLDSVSYLLDIFSLIFPRSKDK